MAGQIAPALMGLLAVPYILHGLGIVRFGVLSLAWVVLAYLGLFDFGLGRATTRFVADAIARGDRPSLPAIVWTSLTVQLLLGLVGAIGFALATPTLVRVAFRVPAYLTDETMAVCYILSASVPLLLCSASLKGILEASNRFDLTNAVRTVGGSLLFLAPAIGVALHLNLAGIMAVLVLSMVGTMAAYFGLCMHIYPSLRTAIRPDARRLRSFFSFGGWVTISSLAIPLLIYSDRFMLSALGGVAVLAYYTVPFDVVSRLQVLPGSLGAAIFPTFSSMSASEPSRLSELHLRAVRYLALVMCPIVLAIVLGANLFLTLWLGRSFASYGTLALQLLAIGVAFNALSQIPAQLLDGMGRPDLRARLLVSYLLPYLGLAGLLIAVWGLNGAAMAWAIRAVVEFALFMSVADAQLGGDPRALLHHKVVRPLLAFAVVAGAGAATVTVDRDNPAAEIGVMVISAALLLAALWAFALEPGERLKLSRFAGRVGQEIELKLRTNHR